MSERAVREALERTQAWRAMSRAFSPPQDLAAIREDLAALRGRSRDALDDALAAALDALVHEDADDLVAAHAALFGPGGAVPPRESAWADARIVAPVELADMRGFLRAFGLEEKGELADHIATECEVASALALKEAWALAQGWDEQARIAREAYERLLGDHLLRWFPRFAQRVRQARASAFHAAVAQALALLVASESIRIGLPPGAETPGVPARDCEEAMACGGCGTEGEAPAA